MQVTNNERAFELAELFVQNRSFERFFGDIFKKFEICIWGGGGLGQAVCRWLLENNIEPSFFCDNDISKKCILLNGKVPYISFEILKGIKEQVFVIVAIENKKSNMEVNFQLEEFPNVWHNPLGITTYWIQDFNVSKEEFVYCKTEEFFDENYSKELFKKLMMLRLQNEVVDYRSDFLEGFVSGIQYIEKELIDYSKIYTYIDCGAYIGDSLDNFLSLKSDAEYYLFEMDKRIRKILKKHIEGLPHKIQDKICVYPYGVGEKSEKVFYASDITGGSKRSQESQEIAEIVALDDMKFEKKIDFIKMDIEGMEEEALNGARELISRDHPILAISVYHNLSQFLKVPEIIQNISKGYSFYLRHYKRTIDDTVCYAIYDERNLAVCEKSGLYYT